MNVKVTTQVSVENVDIGVADKDQTTAARTTKYDEVLLLCHCCLLIDELHKDFVP